LAIPNAEIRATALNSVTHSAADGTFRLDNLPSGQIELVVQAAGGQGYWPSQVTVTTRDRTESPVVVTLVPQNSAVPDRIVLQPNRVTLDPGAVQAFEAVLWAGSTRVQLAPSWLVEGGVGTIGPPQVGVFRAARPGEGKVIAVVGGTRSEAIVTVTQPQPPRIWSVFVDPTQLPATGGQATFTVHATDGDGIARVSATIYKPDGTNETITLNRVSGIQNGDAWIDATYAKTYNFPRNTATPDALGNQPVQVYDIRFEVRDTAGSQSVKNASTGQEWYQVTVLGLEAPPSPGT
jgi:hypothetical protein